MALRVTEDEFRTFLARQGKEVAVIVPRETPKPSKYGNKRTVIDGLVFDSKGEAGRWMELRTMEKAGLIERLERQVRISLEVNGHHICTYVADFVYYQDDERIVEDFKGKRTDTYMLKSKLFAAIHGQRIKEVQTRR
jgi:hypothetical protein